MAIGTDDLDSLIAECTPGVETDEVVVRAKALAVLMRDFKLSRLQAGGILMERQPEVQAESEADSKAAAEIVAAINKAISGTGEIDPRSEPSTYPDGVVPEFQRNE